MSTQAANFKLHSVSGLMQYTIDDGLQPAINPIIERHHEAPQNYNTSGLEVEQPPLETDNSRQVSGQIFAGKGTTKRPSRKKDDRLCGLQRSSFFLFATLTTVLVVSAAVGGGVGSRLSRKGAKPSSSPANTVVLGPTVTVIQQDTATISAASSSSNAPRITLAPSESYSVISSPTLTLSRDCPGSNGTTVVTNDVPPQPFIKHCSWLYKTTPFVLFGEVTSTLDDCIELCAAYTLLNGTSNCSWAAWRTDVTLELPGYCFGYNNSIEAGTGEPASGPDGSCDSALFEG